MGQMGQNRQHLWQKFTCRPAIAAGFAAVAGVIIGRTVLAPVCVVDGTSMAPNYQPGARLCTARISKPLERGDVVLIDDGEEGYAVKRLIGMPGETVQIWRGKVFINQRMLVEPYLPKNTFTCPIERKYLGANFTVGENEYFVLGDNRRESTDSRTYGPVPRARIKRLIPLPKSFTRARLLHYTLPDSGRSLIRPL